jgi:hypothetical protein
MQAITNGAGHAVENVQGSGGMMEGVTGTSTAETAAGASMGVAAVGTASRHTAELSSKLLLLRTP